MDWKRLIDKTLGTNFDAPQYDPQKGRDKLIKAIDTAAKQHNEGSTKAPNRSWKLGGNNAIRFIPTLNGNPMMLDEGTPLYVPAEHFQTLLTEMKASVQNGDLDKQIKAALEGEKGSGSATATRKPSTPKSTRSKDEQHPSNDRTDWETLDRSTRSSISARYRFGKNPDGSLISEAGYQPNAKLA